MSAGDPDQSPCLFVILLVLIEKRWDAWISAHREELRSEELRVQEQDKDNGPNRLFV